MEVPRNKRTFDVETSEEKGCSLVVVFFGLQVWLKIMPRLTRKVYVTMALGKLALTRMDFFNRWSEPKCVSFGRFSYGTWMVLVPDTWTGRFTEPFFLPPQNMHGDATNGSAVNRSDPGGESTAETTCSRRLFQASVLSFSCRPTTKSSFICVGGFTLD